MDSRKRKTFASGCIFPDTLVKDISQKDGESVATIEFTGRKEVKTYRLIRTNGGLRFELAFSCSTQEKGC